MSYSNIKKPDFIIAGATRSGTTTLHHMLSRSASIFMPPEKELNVFRRDDFYRLGLDYYESFFDGAENGQIAGEASPAYFEQGLRSDSEATHIYDAQDDAAARIRAHYPDIRLIFSLRDPVERIYSIYQKAHSLGKDTVADFQTAIEMEMTGRRSHKTSKFAYLYYGLHGHHLERWLSLFPRAQIHVMIFEEWTRDPAPHMQALGEFLGTQLDTASMHVPHTNRGRTQRAQLLYPLARTLRHIPGMRRINRKLTTRAGYAPLDEETERWLRDYYADDIAKCERLLGRELAMWKNDNHTQTGSEA